MINEIEDAIVERLTGQLAAAFIDVQKGFEGIPQPAVYVSTEAGEFVKLSAASFRQTLTIFVDIIFSHLASERERRKGMYLILEGVLQSLLMQTLGLQITRLAPSNWRNTTTEEFRSKGLLTFSLEMKTSYTISVTDDEEVYDLLRVGLSYYLQDPEDDDAADAADVVELGE